MIDVHAVVRIRAGGRDDNGDRVESEEDSETVPGAFVAPRLADDVNGPNRDGTVVGLTLYAPYGADLDRRDLIAVDGVNYRIDGDLGDWSSPLTGSRPGTTANLVRAAG